MNKLAGNHTDAASVPAELPSAQNPPSIREMFGKIAEKYDLANTVLSFGIHTLWKRELVRQSQLRSGHHVLDCATGTGDLAFLFESALQKRSASQKPGRVIGCDFCEPMLEVARAKASRRGSQVQFEWADVTQLPYADGEFDVACISFGIRNTENTVKALSELGRVVKKGGRVLVLEFGQPRSKIMGALYGFYSQCLLPGMGGLISGQKKAYRYLQASSAAYPCGDEFLNLAANTGWFSDLKFKAFQGGIAYLYILQKS
jgi:demethylmenaquinone methyltransferase/2-methoxy-6-polyprenyl-1,4-benzoquinol methylase